jgi:hypothetical protein
LQGKKQECSEKNIISFLIQEVGSVSCREFFSFLFGTGLLGYSLRGKGRKQKKSLCLFEPSVIFLKRLRKGYLMQGNALHCSQIGLG